MVCFQNLVLFALFAAVTAGMALDKELLEDEQMGEWKWITPEDFEAAARLNLTDEDYLIDPPEDDDVILHDSVREINPHKLWPNGVVHYRLSRDFDEDDTLKIAKGIKEIEEKTCIRFVEKKQQDGVSNWVDIVDGRGCSSHIGMMGRGAQRLTLARLRRGRTCVTPGLTIHEFMHALGFAHEHTRPDRDQWVDIHEDNIKDSKLHNFEPKQDSSYTLDQPYDYYSIMHYSPKSFTKNGLDTITPKPGKGYEYLGECQRMGQHCHLTDTDALQLNLLYKCNTKATCQGVINWIGDGICDMVNVNEACLWDGGDCCQGKKNWIGDGFCDMVNNNQACQWDGGDCDNSGQ